MFLLVYLIILTRYKLTVLKRMLRVDDQAEIRAVLRRLMNDTRLNIQQLTHLPADSIIIVHQTFPVVLLEEAAPLVGQQRPVRLYAVVYQSAAAILSLKHKRSAVETDRAHQRFASVPCEAHLRLRLRLDVLLYELLQRLVVHQRALLLFVGVEMSLLQVVAVLAREIAYAPDGLRHDI